MSNPPILRAVDAVTVPVPDLDQGLAYYRDGLGHEVIWRNDELGQVGLRLPDSNADLVLTTQQSYEVNWLVDAPEVGRFDREDLTGLEKFVAALAPRIQWERL